MDNWTKQIILSEKKIKKTNDNLHHVLVHTLSVCAMIMFLYGLHTHLQRIQNIFDNYLLITKIRINEKKLHFHKVYK